MRINLFFVFILVLYSCESSNPYEDQSAELNTTWSSTQTELFAFRDTLQARDKALSQAYVSLKPAEDKIIDDELFRQLEAVKLNCQNQRRRLSVLKQKWRDQRKQWEENQNDVSAIDLGVSQDRLSERLVERLPELQAFQLATVDSLSRWESQLADVFEAFRVEAENYHSLLQ